MNSCSRVISEIAQAEFEEELLKVFKSDRRKIWKWLKNKLKTRGVKSRFATIIARREAATDGLLKLDPQEINRFISSLVEEFKEAGFNEETALINPGRLRELKRLGLSINMMSIRRDPQKLLKQEQELERSGLPVNTNTLCRNLQNLLKREQELERSGLPVNTSNLCMTQKSLAEKVKRLKRTSSSMP